ncbi:hypothetical protein LTR99_004164 [Exophiala xenobiotica]|nr:hypothetical protein LTR99_004164 [Exophiala xenobiotica]KAK5435633.1 hypothetical protein LTR34_003137 [Exophiala xenobiotica]KAK5549282.1 hypothetical protein LTR23_001112 [Chaetothyriales sp. CCFEE 6169]
MADPRVLAVDGFTKHSHQSVTPEMEPICIIGASQGIGEHIAYAYARAHAARIVISSRSVHDLESVANNIKGINPTTQTDIVECDISKPTSVEALASYVRTRCGRLDLLILNAGYAGPVTVKMDEGKPEWVHKAFEVNAMGTYLAAHYFVPLLLASPNGAKGFIAIGSVAGCIRRGPIANTGYTVSKMAQIRLVEYLHEQYGGQGLVRLAVHPGAVATRMAKGNTPEEFLPCKYSHYEPVTSVCVIEADGLWGDRLDR